jgi:hypothetical protein
LSIDKVVDIAMSTSAKRNRVLDPCRLHIPIIMQELKVALVSQFELYPSRSLMIGLISRRDSKPASK